MKLTIFATTVISIMMASTTFAVVGSSANRVIGGNAGICRILARSTDGTLQYTCSATLVTPRKILTAVHCLPTNDQIATVECGFQGYKKSELVIEKTKAGSQIYTKGVIFKETARAKPFFKDTNRDSAIMILDKNLTTPTIDVMTDATYNDISQCVISGYGRTNDGTGGILYHGIFGQSGFARGGRLVSLSFLKGQGIQSADLDSADKATKISEKKFLSEKMTDVIARPGDSGSPLVCKKKHR